MSLIVAFSPVMVSTAGFSGNVLCNAATAPKEIKTYPAGQYKVGTDIEAGEYVLFAKGGMGYFCISSDSNGDDIIQNDNFDYNSIVTVTDGQYLELVRCKAEPIDDADEIALTATGMFKVGTHIPAGEYKLIADGGLGYYCIYDSSTHENIISNNNFDNTQYVTVSDGQYLVLVRCKFETPPEKPVSAETIKMVQEELNANGYDCGTPDGQIGANTIAAIEQYQTDHKLDVSGTVNAELLTSMGIGNGDAQKSSDKKSVSIDEFVKRYNAATDYYNATAKQAGYPIAGYITADMARGSENFRPNDNVKLAVNPNSKSKDDIGILNIWAEDVSAIDTTLLAGEVMAALYAFDTSLEDESTAFDLASELLKETNIQRHGITFKNYSFKGMLMQVAMYDDFELVK